MRHSFITKTAKLACLCAVALFGPTHIASAQLNVQIVNDSGLPDSNVFIMVPGASPAGIAPQILFVDKNVGSNTAVSLSTLATDGFPTFPLTSPISGNTNTVYSFQVTNISSGAIYFIYNYPFVFTNGTTPSPAPGAGNGVSGYRYDYAELSYVTNGDNNDVDLTYVDKYGIPLQLEWFQGANTAATNLEGGSYVYASTKTLVNLFAANGLANAAFSLVNPGTVNGDITPGWQYNTGPASYTNFARIVSPEKASANGASVSPYPSVTNYLNFLITNPFVLNGYSVQGGTALTTNAQSVVTTNNYLYYYLGYEVSVAANTSNGWTFTLSYNPALLPASYNLTNIGAIAGGTATDTNIPVQFTNTIVFSLQETNIPGVSALVYGAPVGTNFLVNGVQVTNTSYASYNVEAWMIGDVFSSINYGFPGGIYGSNSALWYSPKIAWTSYPYGWAQPSPYNNPTNGFYNPYAALMYYNADAYTFAFSERITPDVGMPVVSNDTIRITILPDDRLDSPVPEVEAVSSNSITVDWNPVPGATSYLVNMLRPLGTPSVNTASTSCTFNNLIPGAPYVISVQAMGIENGNPIITPARPITTMTAGTYTETNGNLVQINAALSGISDPFARLHSAYINGIELTPTNGSWYAAHGANPNWWAWEGTNQVPIIILDQSSNIVFDDWATFVLAPPAMNASYGTNFYTKISDLNFYGQVVGKSPTFAADPYVTTNGIIPTNDASVVLSFIYAPAEIRRSNPLNVVLPPPASVTITDIHTIPGNGIQFNFTVPNGTNYLILTSTNLFDWQTNASGVGTSVQESYTNTPATNRRQFYRIKLP